MIISVQFMFQCACFHRCFTGLSSPSARSDITPVSRGAYEFLYGITSCDRSNKSSDSHVYVHVPMIIQ